MLHELLGQGRSNEGFIRLDRRPCKRLPNVSANGDPTLLAVVDTGNRTTFYQLEDGRFHRPGKNWLDFVGKRVEIAGPVRTKKDVNFVKVDALKVIAEAPAASEQQPKVIGSESELVMKDLFGVEQKLKQLSWSDCSA